MGNNIRDVPDNESYEMEDRPVLEIEITPEMIEAGEEELYQHLTLEPGSGDVRECVRAAFETMTSSIRPRCLPPSCELRTGIC